MNGRICLTFDDGLECQLDHAIPVLDWHGLAGTFFLVTESVAYPFDLAKWRAAAVLHEIGSHSRTHPKAAELNWKQAKSELLDSKHALEILFDRSIDSFCWPYTDSSRPLQKLAMDCGYRQARGGRAARRSKYLVQGDGVNPFAVPCYHVNDGLFPHEEIYGLIDAAMYRNAGLVLMFHAVGDPAGWDNVTTASFEELCGFLAQRRAHGLQVQTFEKLMEHYR